MSEEQDNAGIIAHPPFFYLGSVIIALIVDYFYPLELGYEAITKPAAIVAIILGVFVFVAGGKMFRSDKQNVSVHTKTENLYQEGIYGYSRNPIYLGAMLLCVAGGLYFSKLWILVMLVPLFFFMNKFIIGKEEAYLEKKFGEEYISYMKKVRRWI